MIAIVGILMFLSLAMTRPSGRPCSRALRESDFVADHINPGAVGLVDTSSSNTRRPMALTFLACFTLYKFIPEVKVYTRSADRRGRGRPALGGLQADIRLLRGQFLGRRQSSSPSCSSGTLTSIIFFLLWISFSLVILLWGAELAAVLNEKVPTRPAGRRRQRARAAATKPV